MNAKPAKARALSIRSLHAAFFPARSGDFHGLSNPGLEFPSDHPRLRRTSFGRLVAPVLSLLAVGCALLLSVGPVRSGPRKAPDFVLGRCVKADTLRLADFGAHPVILFFFDAGDMANSQAYRYVRNWNPKYRGDSVFVIGIHCPSLEPLKIWENAITAVARAQLEFPVGIDMQGEVCMEYALEHLPTFILVKPDGDIGFETSDPDKYGTVEEVLQKTIRDLKPGTPLPFLFKPRTDQYPPDARIFHPTPKMVLGLSSGAIDGCDSTCLGRYKAYTDSRGRKRDRAYLQGRWKLEQDALFYEQGEESYLRVIYSGKDVWVLPEIEPEAPVRVYVKQDRAYLDSGSWGRDLRTDKTGRPYIYMRHSVPVHIVSNPAYGTHELQLVPVDGDVGFHYLFFEGGAAE